MLRVVAWTKRRREEADDGDDAPQIKRVKSERCDDGAWSMERRVRRLVRDARWPASPDDGVDVLKAIWRRRSDIGLNGLRNTILATVREGSLVLVQWLDEYVSDGWSTLAMDEAARLGRLDVVRYLHTHRREGCTTNAMDEAARNGHLPVVQWLHANRTEGCSTNAMDFAASMGHWEIVKWLHANRTEEYTSWAVDRVAERKDWRMVGWLVSNRRERFPSSYMEATVERGQVRVVQALYDREELRSWPRPVHASILFKLVVSTESNSLAVLKHIVSRRRHRYSAEAPDNPIYQPAEDATSNKKKDENNSQLMLFVVATIGRTMGMAAEVAQLVSDFLLPDPRHLIAQEKARERGWVHWLLRFSNSPNRMMELLVENKQLIEARWMHDTLQKEGRLQCSKRLLYLTMEHGDLSSVQWHLRECHAHSIDNWAYVATWMGRVDVIDWMQASRLEMIVWSRDRVEKPTVPMMFHSLDASFSSVAARFECDLMTVESFMKAEGSRRGMEAWNEVDTQAISSNESDLAVTMRPDDAVDDLIRLNKLCCTVSGLYGAIARGKHVFSIYASQPELSVWPLVEDGAMVLRHYLSPVNAVMLNFFRRKRGMCLEPRDLDEAVFQQDMERVQLIHQLDLVDWTTVTTNAADLAAVHGNLEMLCLIHAGTRVLRCTTRAMEGASENGNLPVVQYLHEHGAVSSRRAMDFAAKNGHIQVLEYLFQHGRERCSPYGMYWACASGQTEVVAYLTAISAPIDFDLCLSEARSQGYEAMVNVLEGYRATCTRRHGLESSSRHSLRRHRHKQLKIESTVLQVCANQTRVVYDELEAELFPSNPIPLTSECDYILELGDFYDEGLDLEGANIDLEPHVTPGGDATQHDSDGSAK